MGAALSDIDGSIMAALQTLLARAAPAGPFKRVARFAYDPKRALEEQITTAIGPATPGALLWTEGGDGANDWESLAGVDEETVERSTWTVLVCNVDPRDGALALTGSPTIPGVYALVDAVQAALNGLPIDGLYRSTRLRYHNFRWLMASGAGLYVMAVRFVAARVLPDAPADGDAVYDLTEVDAAINLPTGDSPAPPNPIDSLVINTTQT